MAARKLNPHTQRNHINRCKRFTAWLKRSPDTATASSVRRYSCTSWRTARASADHDLGEAREAEKANRRRPFSSVPARASLRRGRRLPIGCRLAFAGTAGAARIAMRIALGVAATTAPATGATHPAEGIMCRRAARKVALTARRQKSSPSRAAFAVALSR